MRLICWISILVFASSPGFASDSEEKAFAAGVAKYVRMQQDLEGSVPAQKTTGEPEQIIDRQHQLTGVLANARRNAHQGELFTDEIADHFRKIIRKAFHEPGGRAMRKTIEERIPARAIAIRVNDVYPDDQPRTTMPPTLLNRLPGLPKELGYRIVGRTLVLQDTRTNLIVDFILNAIP